MRIVTGGLPVDFHASTPTVLSIDPAASKSPQPAGLPGPPTIWYVTLSTTAAPAPPDENAVP